MFAAAPCEASGTADVRRGGLDDGIVWYLLLRLQALFPGGKRQDRATVDRRDHIE